MQLVRDVGDARAQIDILNNLGVVAKSRARYADAVGHYEEGQRLDDDRDEDRGAGLQRRIIEEADQPALPDDE
jgi:hypothetical protein